jgi:hypothetical protein
MVGYTSIDVFRLDVTIVLKFLFMFGQYTLHYT